MTLTSDSIILVAIAGVVIVAAIVLFTARRKRPVDLGLDPLKSTKEPEKEPQKETPVITSPSIPTAVQSPVYTTISRDDVQKAEDDLRILSVEKEIVSYALTRLFEAQAEGKINEKDKDKLLGKYKVEMTTLEKQMNDKQMVVRLHELESTQADLIKLFQDKFVEINRNIEAIRVNLGLQAPIKPSEPAAKKTEDKPSEQEGLQEAKGEPKADASGEEKEKVAPRPRAPAKSKAEEKVEAIQQEVLKILERLEKQEAES